MSDMIKNDKRVSENIRNKKILFFSPAFFGYENKIVQKMTELGAHVDMYDVRSVKSARDRAIIKISPELFKRRSLNYYENIISENKEKNYDYILIVRCDMTPKSIFQKFRNAFPKAKICLYLWDSVANTPGIINKFQYFDALYSFDLEDCNKYPVLKFRPLFYIDEFCKSTDEFEYEYDICFVGTIHSDRFSVIRQVREIEKNNNLKCYYFCYLQSKFIYYFYKLIKKEFRDTEFSDFNFNKMTSKEISEIVEKSKIVLDIQHPKQSGLTMRTIEMIGMNKKLITTNSAITQYDFYNPNNISVVDRKNIQIGKDFLQTSYEPLDLDVYKNYSLENWIIEVLS